MAPSFARIVTMGRGMSDEVSNLVVQALNRGLPRNEISNVVGMSKRSITRVSTNLRKHGTPRAPPTGIKLGRPGKMNAAQAQVSSRSFYFISMC